MIPATARAPWCCAAALAAVAACGLGHLLGDEGLLAMFERAGDRVTRAAP